MNALHHDIWYSCDKCEDKFPTKNTLTIHVRKVHLQIKPYKCFHCQKTFLARGNTWNQQKKLSSNYVKRNTWVKTISEDIFFSIMEKNHINAFCMNLYAKPKNETPGIMKKCKVFQFACMKVKRMYTCHPPCVFICIQDRQLLSVRVCINYFCLRSLCTYLLFLIL